MSRNLLLATLVVAIAAVGGFALTQRGGADLPPALSTAASAQEAAPETASADQTVPDMVLGQADAPVTVIEYASFTCPHCQNFHETVFDRLKADYIDTGKVRFVYREVYFDKFGLWAAMVARCGGETKYFGIADMLYDDQKEWLAPGEEAGIADNLRKIGLRAGIDEAALDACMKDSGMAEAMVAAYQANATEDGIDSTPSFVIDGEKFPNMTYEEFATTLDAKLGG